MMYSNEKDSKMPYCFAKIQGIMRVKALYTGGATNSSLEMDVLWVRWYRISNENEFGWENRRLPRVKFMADRYDKKCQAYGFMDPRDVIRAVHLIPDFIRGEVIRGEDEINPFRRYINEEDTVKEYKRYYVNW